MGVDVIILQIYEWKDKLVRGWGWWGGDNDTQKTGFVHTLK
jgi:hypothetical protein